MRETICKLLFKIGLVRFAYAVSPSICFHLAGEKAAEGMAEGLKYE